MTLKNISTYLLLKELTKRDDEKNLSKNWYNILIDMIDKEAKNHIGPREFDSIGRTEVIKEICDLLTDIQYTVSFSERYEIIYVKQND